jgi:prepilin-type N-terminal cleavage/methylation domain-containing protein
MKRLQRKSVLGSRGFTLTETLVAISLSSILAGVAIPATGELLQNYRLSNATKHLSSQINRARMQAIGQRMFVRVLVQGDGTYALFRSTDGVSYSMDGTVMSLPEGVAVTVGPTGAPTFNRQGMSTTGSVITLSNGEGSKTVTMNVLGRVTIS